MGRRVEVVGLTKAFAHGSRVLDDVSFAAEPGEIVALVGPNGAGKSTLLRCIVRLVEPTEGRVLIGNTKVTGCSSRHLREVRRSTGFVFQRFNLVPRLSSFHNVLLGALGRSRLRGLSPALASRDDRREAMACLERVGLAALADRRADTLSGGQQQRVAIARMIMQRPEVVLADEPVASLDPSAGLAVMELLREIARERNLTVIVALHQLELARHYADRVIGLRAGRLTLDFAAGDWRQTAVDELYDSMESERWIATPAAASRR